MNKEEFDNLTFKEIRNHIRYKDRPHSILIVDCVEGLICIADDNDCSRWVRFENCELLVQTWRKIDA
jgi:hypothetical protein